MAPPADFEHRGSCARMLQKRGYTLAECIGSGAYAKVYMAEYIDVERSDDDSHRIQELACKMIDADTAPRDFIQKFLPRELEIMSRIHYKFCLRIHSVIQRKHLYFVFTQFCPNGDLLDFIRGNGCVKEKQAWKWFAQLLKALNYLQTKNIAHRDLKCENILLTGSYNIKLGDFGFARIVSSGEEGSLTFCGSVSYAAPELIRGKPYNPFKSDVWSAGVVLYVMLNKSLPFDDSNVRKLYDAQSRRAWRFRSKVVSFISKELKDFMYEILDPDPNTRLSAIQLWNHPWIQHVHINKSETEDKVTPPNSALDSSVLQRNQIYWEKEEKKMELDPTIEPSNELYLRQISTNLQTS